MGVRGIFRKVFGWIPKLFSRGAAQRVAHTVSRVSDLAEHALPVVRMVAALTPTPVDDIIVEALTRLGMTAEQVLDQSNELLHDAARQRLAAEILILRLVRLVQAKGSVQIGDETLDTVSQILEIDKTTLLAAVQNAVAVWKALNARQ